LCVYVFVIFLPPQWDSTANFQHRDALRTLIFVFSLWGPIAYHSNLTKKVKKRTDVEMRKAVRQTTLVVEALFALGAPLTAMSSVTELVTHEHEAITNLRKTNHFQMILARAFTIPILTLVFYYFDQMLLVYCCCVVYAVILASVLVLWHGHVKAASFLYHGTLFIGIQATMAVTGGIDSFLTMLVPLHVVSTFHCLGYTAGMYTAYFAMAWYVLLYLSPSSKNVLSDWSESTLEWYHIFSFSHCAIGIVSINVELRKFLNRQVRKLEFGLADLGPQLGFPARSPSPKPQGFAKVVYDVRQREKAVRRWCTVCGKERWHTIHATVIKQDHFVSAYAYTCTRCKGKAVDSIFPEATAPRSARHSSPAVVERTLERQLEPTPAPASPELLMRRAPQSGPMMPSGTQSKDEVKDQLLKLLQASDAWMDALQCSTPSP